jgi:uncharacterized protein (DUF433 family)
MTIPLQEDTAGAIHVSGTRVTLDSLIARYQQGDSPEMIHEGFPGVPLTDVYAVIAYYLAHRDEVDAYLEQRDEEGEANRQQVEAQYTPEQKARTDHFRELLAKKRREQNH